MKNSSPVKERILLMSGILFVLSGVLLNERVLAAFFSKDGIIAVPHRFVIWISDLLFIGVGLTIIIYRRSLSRRKILFVAGLLLISAGILCNNQNVSVLFHVNLGIERKILILMSDIFMILSGLLLIFISKSAEKKNVLLFGISSLICLMALLFFDCCTSEDFMRLVHPSVPVKRDRSFVRDDHLGWIPKANSNEEHINKGYFNVRYEIDKNGFRKIDNAENPDFSIYFFGDSFTFGGGVNNEDNFPAIIHDRYLKRTVNVYNAGVNAYGIAQMYQRFLNIEDDIHPGDLVIFTPLDDDILRNIRDFYFPYYHFFAGLVPFEYYPFFDNGVIKYHRMENSFYNKLKVVVLYARFSGPYWRDLLKEFIPDTTREALDMIKVVKQRTEMKGGKFILIFLPDTWECLGGKYKLDISDFTYHDIMRYFPTQPDELKKIRFSADDGHWNVKGHEIAARAIVGTLADEKLIDRKYLKDSRHSGDQ